MQTNDYFDVSQASTILRLLSRRRRRSGCLASFLSLHSLQKKLWRGIPALTGSDTFSRKNPREIQVNAFTFFKPMVELEITYPMMLCQCVYARIYTLGASFLKNYVNEGTNDTPLGARILKALQ
ncbi:hypothetical protein [Salisediminibacterium halotolerans]|uniref:hypothetical protein n=1 Tax=Salisediminibacterium halotolerans TaxID=517425 RepID=UPI00115FD719|nr:hypothetical protein [Salisediminibacterium haloalkalitolerans]